MDYMPWLLRQSKNYDTATANGCSNFTLHYYPQGGEFGDDMSAAMQAGATARRDRCGTQITWMKRRSTTRSNSIPRMKSWVAQYYPNTQIGITEYNWGAEDNINGATTQADIFGIFGREGMDIATRWTTPATGTPRSTR